MSFSLFLMAMVANPQPPLPTDGLLTVENLDCVSKKVSADQAQSYYAMARKGKEIDAFQSASTLTKACQAKYGWTDIQTRSAFRISMMDGWLLQEGLVGKIQALGDFKPFLDRYYRDNVKPTGRYMLEDVFLSGKMDKDLTAAGYPEDKELRELAYNYWEWRGALFGIEEDFRNGELRQ
ncbi:MAG: hypothetical protein ABJP02_13770 [Parasphingorhabdus sp.]|uniref:hypothetical protein n=1 Tax=Parasphingorhabdus sp. TaxID=2709688 RepID=UPI0032993995